MSQIERDITFAVGRVELDGRVFVNCNFQRVRLAYLGRDVTVLWNCAFPEKNALEFELGEIPGKFIWDVGVAHRFGDRALAESVARYIEGTALTLPEAVRKFSALPHLPASLREIAAAIPETLTSALRFVRGEIQRSIPEPVRVICRNPRCHKITVVRSMLPPGAKRSVSQSNAMSCPECGFLAQIEDHWTDDSGRVFREFTDRILRESDLPKAAIEQLQLAARGAGNKTANQSAEEIEKIDERLEPIANEVRKMVDRRQFLSHMAILGVVASAILLGGNAIANLEPTNLAADPVASATTISIQPTIQARELTIDEAAEALGTQLEAICRAAADDPGISAVELREMAEACRLEAHDRHRLAAERSAQTSGYLQHFWSTLIKPDVGANALASGLLATLLTLLCTGISARLTRDQ